MNYAASAEPRFRPLRITRQHRYAVASAGAAIVAILLAVGWIAGSNRRPANPLGTGALIQQQNIEQESPFGSTTLKPVNQQAGSSNQRSVVSRQQKPVAPVSATRPVSVASGPHKPAAATPLKRTRRVAHEDLADDVVVRHFANGKPVPAKTTAQTQQKQQAGLKKISDLQ